MRVCTECGWRFEDDRSTCLVCGGEVVPSDELFLPPPQPLASRLAWLSRRLRPLRYRWRRALEQADVAHGDGPGFGMWWQDTRRRFPGPLTLVGLLFLAAFFGLTLGPALYNLVREWLGR